MKAARIVKVNQPLQVLELQTSTEVLIKFLSVIEGVINP